MRRTSLLSVVSLSAAVLFAACGEPSRTGLLPTTPGSAEPSANAPRRGAATAPAPGTCTTLSNLEALADAAYGAGSPDVNSVKGKINNLQHQIDINDVAATKSQAFNIVTFTLKKHSQSPLPGGDAAVVAFVNAVFCYAGLPISITDPANSFLIYPSDLPQTLVNNTGLAGIQLDSFPVSEPTLITIAPIPYTVIAPGSGPLSTKLDQYPGFYQFENFSETGAPLVKPVVVGICPAAEVPSSVRPTLRLGHDASYGFELTPPAAVPFLNCPAALARADQPSGFGRVLSLFAPRNAWASPFFDMGGVGGSVTELSPFAPVDETVYFSGGVGGSVTELIRGSIKSLLGSCTTAQAPVGTPLDADCRPMVVLKTLKGTRLANAPVSFSVESGGGTVAAQGAAGECLSSFGSSVVSNSSLTGRAAACWTMGVVPGPNTVRATPGVGGDIPSGVSFSPSSQLFTATANAPTGFVFLAQPAAGSTVTAGTLFNVTAAAVDQNGVIAQGWNGAVTLSLNHGTFAGAVASLTATAVNGVASFTGVAITAAGSDYRLQATADFFGAITTSAGASFSIGAAAANGLQIVAGNGQSAPAGSTLPINPTVAVTDAYGNAVSGANINWIAGGSSTGYVTPTSGATNAAGQAQTSWTVGAGANELRAALSRGAAPDTVVLFTATGTTAALVSLNSCAPGGSGDPFNDPTKPFAFWIPDPGNGKVIKQVQLYISSAGQANAPAAYQLRLSTQRGTFDQGVSVPVYTTSNVFLRGNNSEAKMVTFTLATPIVGANGSSAKPVMMKLEAITNPDGAKLSFNTGPCAPGKSCNPPPNCKATEVSSPTPFPTGTFYRKSVGINVLGN
jgi:hypothetical protein